MSPPGEGPRVLLAGLDLVPSSGGAVKTMGLFARALAATVVGFTDPRKLAAEGSAIPGALQVPVSTGPAGRLFAWAPAAACREADAAAATADLYSCHILYRAHAHWVARHARRRGRPYWVVPHGCLDPWVFTYRAWLKRPWMATFGQRFVSGAAAIICATRREAEKAAPWLGRAPVRVVPWPVATLDTEPRAADRMALRQDLRLPAEARVLLFLGRLHPMKRVLETVEVLAQAARAGGAAGTDVHLAVVGPEEGVTAADVLERAAAAGLTGRVHVPGPAYGPAKDRWLRGADALVSFSHRENFGHTVAEALGAGTPVILGPGVDLAADLAPVAPGWFARGDTTEAWAEALAAWLAAPAEEATARGARGRDWVAAELSYDHFRARLQSLARETVAQAARR